MTYLLNDILIEGLGTQWYQLAEKLVDLLSGLVIFQLEQLAMCLDHFAAYRLGYRVHLLLPGLVLGDALLLRDGDGILRVVGAWCWL